VNLNTFIRERSPDWEAFDAQLRASKGRPERLGVPGALQFGRRYRAVAADLAIARSRFPGDPVLGRLTDLTLRGRQAIYSERTRRIGSVWRFVSRGYWRLILARPGPLGLAALATAVPCLLAAGWAVHAPGAAAGLLPAQFQAGGNPRSHPLHLSAAGHAIFASSIFTNNIGVTFLVFAGGLTFGLVTLGVLAYNGMILGALAGLTIATGKFALFTRLVVPHGILELSCFTVAGAAGLRMAWAMIDPGTLSRGASLRQAARPAVALVLGTAPCLVIAGLTEGFVTPELLPLGEALAVGLVLGLGYWSLVLVRGRRGTPSAPGSAPARTPGRRGHRRPRDLAST
jgi:uncharacterized membrane protein SpoIIM required for sporulation